MFRLLRQEDVRDWLSMPCARPCSRTRIQALVETLRRTERVEGFIALAVVDGKLYILDGLHRVEAFRQSKLSTVSAEVRVYRLNSMKEATDKFLSFQSYVGGYPAQRKRMQD